jgi:hypothetical protein
MLTLKEFGYDGLAALRWTLTIQNGYPSLEQAVAALALFLHPETVAQTSGNIFRMARNGRHRRTFDDADQPTVMWDDNAGPHVALKAAGAPAMERHHLELNHLYGAKVDCFTELRSFCITPSFLKKLTDSEPRILVLLRRRSFVLYDFAPMGEPSADGYEDLEWAPPLPPVKDLSSTLSGMLAHLESNHTARSVRQFGWCFNQFSGNPWKDL